MTLNAGSTAVDARHGHNLRYLLATGQMAASHSGPSGAGLIGNGHVTWDNVDSYAGQLRQELTTARLGHVAIETKWSPRISTQLSFGYQNKDSRIGFGSGATFYAPDAPANPLRGEWTAAASGTSGSAWSDQPSHSRSYRVSLLSEDRLFGGRARSQTITGAEHTKGEYANENFAYYEA